MPHIAHTIPPAGGATLPIAESDVTNLTTDLAAKATDSLAAHLAGAEAFTGVKLFTAGFRYDQQAVSGTATLVNGSQPLVIVDTTSAAFTITLPAAPSAGSVFLFHDKLGTWATNNLTIARNGKNIDGAAANKVAATNTGVFALQYNGTDWRTIWDLLSSTNPIIDGTASPGTSQDAARGDHVHPTDTSRAPLASPTLTGTPAAPTAAQGTNTTQVATTAMVHSEAVLLAPIASPTFTGTPAAPTAAADTNTTQVATTANVVSTAIPKSLLTTNGDSIIRSGGVPARLAVGSAGQRLTVENGLPAWQKAAGSFLMRSGALAETFSRNAAGGTSGMGTLTTPLTTGVTRFCAIELVAGMVISNITFLAGGTTTMAGATHQWCAITDSSRVQVATCTDDTTAANWTQLTEKTWAIAQIASGASGTYTVPTTGLYYLVIDIVATTMPTLVGTTGFATTAALAPILSGTSETLSSAPPAFTKTYSAITSDAKQPWAYVS